MAWRGSIRRGFLDPSGKRLCGRPTALVPLRRGGSSESGRTRSNWAGCYTEGGQNPRRGCQHRAESEGRDARGAGGVRAPTWCHCPPTASSPMLGGRLRAGLAGRGAEGCPQRGLQARAAHGGGGGGAAGDVGIDAAGAGRSGGRARSVRHGRQAVHPRGDARDATGKNEARVLFGWDASTDAGDTRFAAQCAADCRRHVIQGRSAIRAARSGRAGQQAELSGLPARPAATARGSYRASPAPPASGRIARSRRRRRSLRWAA
jgi:hypothetical protein